MRDALVAFLEGDEALETLRVVEDGHRAIEALGVQAFDVVLTDVTMPGMSGLELLQWIRAHHPAIRVIVMSGVLSTEKLDAATELGAHRVLAKPFRDPLRLLEIISEAVDSGPA